MRLINADEHECWACVHHQNESGKCDTWCDAGESFVLRDDVKEAKTAFDVEMVTRELQNANRELCMVMHCKSHCCSICVVKNLLDIQLDIIRKGGVKCF